MEVYFRPIPGRIDDEIFVIETMGPNRISYLHFHAGELVWTEFTHAPGEQWNAQPLFRMRHDECARFITAFVVAAKQARMQLPDDEFASGELKATKEHLADMRRLVFEPTIVENRAVDNSGKGSRK